MEKCFAKLWSIRRPLTETASVWVFARNHDNSLDTGHFVCAKCCYWTLTIYLLSNIIINTIILYHDISCLLPSTPGITKMKSWSFMPTYSCFHVSPWPNWRKNWLVNCANPCAMVDAFPVLGINCPALWSSQASWRPEAEVPNSMTGMSWLDIQCTLKVCHIPR